MNEIKVTLIFSDGHTSVTAYKPSQVASMLDRIAQYVRDGKTFTVSNVEK